MNLNDLLNEWEKDTKIDRTEPGKELLKLPGYHSKYMRIMFDAKGKLKAINNELAKEKKFRFEYYNGWHNTNKELLQEKGLEVIKIQLKSEVDRYIDSDEVIIKLTDKKEYLEQVVKACEYIIQELKNRNFSLRGHIDWEKFVAGG